MYIRFIYINELTIADFPILSPTIEKINHKEGKTKKEMNAGTLNMHSFISWRKNVRLSVFSGTGRSGRFVSLLLDGSGNRGMHTTISYGKR